VSKDVAGGTASAQSSGPEEGMPDAATAEEDLHLVVS